MRKILPALIVALIYLTPLYPVYAVGDSATDSSFIKPGKMLEKRIEAMDAKEDRMEKKEDRMEKREEKMASRAANFAGKLAKFKDKNKAKRVENINTNLNAINLRRTTQMQNALGKMQTALSKMESKTQDVATTGADTADITISINEAKELWTEADEAVKAQMLKDYSIVINDESTVKEDAGLARDSLRADLKAIHTQVVETRKSLADVLKIMASVVKGGKSGS